MKHSIIIRFAICIGFLMNVSLAYSQNDYDVVNISWKWTENDNLKFYSNYANLLDVFNQNAESEENIRNNTWGYETTWLDIPVVKGMAYIITFDVTNENDPRKQSINVIRHRNGGTYREIHNKEIYWGLCFGARKTIDNGDDYIFEIDYNNRKNANNLNTYTSSYTTKTKQWISCTDIPKRTIKIEYDGNETVDIYAGSGNALMKTINNVIGIARIGVKCGNAARIVVSNFKMIRKYNSEALKLAFNGAVQMIDNNNYAAAFRALTSLLTVYEHPTILFFRARSVIGLGEYKYAIQDCDRALEYQCDKELKENLLFLRGYCKLSLNDQTGITDMKQAGEQGMNFLREKNLLNKHTQPAKSSSVNKQKNSPIPQLKKTK